MGSDLCKFGAKGELKELNVKKSDFIFNYLSEKCSHFFFFFVEFIFKSLFLHLAPLALLARNLRKCEPAC